MTGILYRNQSHFVPLLDSDFHTISTK